MVSNRSSAFRKKKRDNRQTPDFKLYLITDRKALRHGASLITAVRNALKGGIRAVQLREKDLDTRELLTLAYKMRDVTSMYKAKLFINDRFDIALAVNADGVHLTQKSIPVEALRKVVKRKLLIGLSAHSLKEAIAAEKGGADFITIGPVYRTPSKLKYGKPVGVKTLNRVSARLTIPVYAIGGIKSGRIDKVKKAGAYGVAMISEIFNAEDIQKKVRDLISVMEA